MRLREARALLKEFMYGSGWMGGASYPGPEPGKVHAMTTTFPGKFDQETPPEKKRLRKAGREREEPRWRRP